MNREDIIRMAKNSGLFVELVLERDLDWLERFAAFVASAEREACAKYIESLMIGDKPLTTVMGALGDFIRARGQA
jgi:hypothetical protein